MLALASLAAQESARQIWDSGFRQQRPPAPASQGKEPMRQPDYRAAADAPPASSNAQVQLIGFTVWRLRPPVTGDTAPRLLVPQSANVGPIELVPVRLPAGAALAVGDSIRLGLEVASQGFLYVIDRERYDDGSRSTASHISHEHTARRRQHRRSRSLDRNPCPRGPRPGATRDARRIPVSGEELTVVVTTAPIPGIVPDSREVALPENVVAGWERRWGVSTTAKRWDLLSAPPGTAWTMAEKEAGLTSRLLTQDDPMPATVYEAIPMGDGSIVRIHLDVK